jgi:zinc protease
MSFQRWILPNGLTCFYQQSAGLPLAAATLMMRTGSAYEPQAHHGLAGLTADLMLQGTQRRSPKQIADEIESVGAALGAHALEDYTEVGFSSPVGSLAHIFDVVTDVLTRASFPMVEVKKERAHVLASLKSRKDTLFNVAYDAFSPALFGAHHPYGRPVDGTRETVQRITRTTLKDWHHESIRPDRAIFSMVSSLSPRIVERQIARTLGSWAGRKAPGYAPDCKEKSLHKNQEIRLHAPFEQAYLMTGTLAPHVLDPDYPVLKVLNTILGGGMSSRLFLHLREELGLAYEVSSFFSTRMAPSQWVIYLGTPPEKLRIARKELEVVLREVQEKGPTEAEVRQAKAMIQGGYLMEHQTRRRQAWDAAWWGFLGKDPEHSREFLKAVERVTARDARALARKLLSQPRVTVEVTPK